MHSLQKYCVYCNNQEKHVVNKKVMQVEEFNDLVARMKDKMFRLALRVVKNEETAHDVVQESFIKVWNKREKLAEIENKDAYCMTIARNMGIDKLRGKKMDISDIDEQYDLRAKTADPERTLVAKQELSNVMKVVNSLPENHRTVIQLRDIEGYSYKEISAMTGYSLEKVKVYLHRARTKLRQQIRRSD